MFRLKLDQNFISYFNCSNKMLRWRNWEFFSWVEAAFVSNSGLTSIIWCSLEVNQLANIKFRIDAANLFNISSNKPSSLALKGVCLESSIRLQSQVSATHKQHQHQTNNQQKLKLHSQLSFHFFLICLNEDKSYLSFWVILILLRICWQSLNRII